MIRRAVCRTLGRLHAGERGITLMELIVAMALSMIVVVAAAGFLGAAQKAQGSVRTIDGNTRTSSNVMNEVGRMLRAATVNPIQNADSAPAFVSATPTLVQFYAFVNLTSSEAKPVKVQFQVVDNQLVETQWASTAVAGTTGYWTYATTPTSTRTIAAPLAISSTSPFTYLASDGVTVLDGTVAANLDDIRFVRVNLEIGSATVGAYSNVVMTTTIALPNVLQENAS